MNLVARITAYLTGGGLFNPELANHDAVRDLLIDCRDALAEPSPVAPDSLVARLRDPSLSCSKGQRGDIHREAADRIEQLGRERDAISAVERMQAATIADLKARLERITQAAATLVKSKGRFHTERAYTDFVTAYHDAIRHTTAI